MSDEKLTDEVLKDYTTDELLKELVNRTTFAGVVVWYTSNVKDGKMEHSEVKTVKSPPLTQHGAEQLLKTGLSLLPGMFGESP